MLFYLGSLGKEALKRVYVSNLVEIGE